jgi:O-antigen/teichoic acid export membrane protein
VLSKVKRALNFVDQALYAAFTLILFVIAARSLAPSSLGVYALVATAHQLSVGLARASTSEVLLWRSPEDGGRALLKEAYRLSGRIGICLSLIIGLTCAVTIAPGYALLCGTLVTTYFHDVSRYNLLATRRVARSTGLHLVAILIIVGGWALLHEWQIVVTPLVILIIGGVASLAFTLGAVNSLSLLMKAPFSRSQTPMREPLRYGADYLLGTLSLQVNLLAAVVIAGPTAAAILRSADTLIGPLRVALQGAIIAVVPQVRERVALGQSTRGPLVAVVGGVALLAGIWHVLLHSPTRVGPLLLGDAWSLADQVDEYYLIAFVASSATAFCTVLLKVSSRGKSLLLARVIAVVLGSAISVVAVWRLGVVGAAIATTVTSVLSTVIWYVVYRGKGT